MSWESFSEWPTGVELDLEVPFEEGFPTESRLFATDHCITLEQPSDVPSTSTIHHFNNRHSNNFTPHDINFTSAHHHAQLTPTDPAAAAATPETATCPCCKQTLDAVHTDLRAHVGPCFLSQQPKAPPRPESSHHHIESIRESATRMSLSHRIGLLESLNRLSQLAKAGAKSGGRPAPSDRTRQSDLFTLSLLFSSPPAAKQPAPASKRSKRRKVTVAELTVDVPVPAFLPAFLPAPDFLEHTSTASASPASPASPATPAAPFFHETWTSRTKPAALSMWSARGPHSLLDVCTPPGYGAAKPSPATKRKRRTDVVQALSFSPVGVGPRAGLVSVGGVDLFTLS